MWRERHVQHAKQAEWRFMRQGPQVPKWDMWAAVCPGVCRQVLWRRRLRQHVRDLSRGRDLRRRQVPMPERAGAVLRYVHPDRIDLLRADG